MRISHNLQAMNVQRQLGIARAKKAKAMERLSSGYRINRAADDAAGLAISEKMRSQIRGLNQASNNVQDGISLCQTADGALSEVHEILQRIRELSVKASNDTYIDDDKKKIQEEVEELIVETDRIVSTAEFNTLTLFKVSEISDSKPDIEDNIYDTILMNKYVPAKKDITLADGQVMDKKSAEELFIFMNSFANINEIIKMPQYGKGGEGSRIYGYFQVLVDNALRFSESITDSRHDRFIKEASREMHSVLTNGGSYDEIRQAYNKFYDAQYLGSSNTKSWYADSILTCVSYAEFGSAYQGNMTSAVERAFRGINLVLQTAGLNSSSELSFMPVSADISKAIGSEYVANIEELYRSVFINSDYEPDEEFLDLDEPIPQASLCNGLWIQSGPGNGDGILLKIDNISSKVLGMQSLDVTSFAGAQNALIKVTEAIGKISKARSTIGAYQNRLEHTVAYIENTSENLQTAESRIRDTDISDEITTLAKHNILEEAGQTLLAQANHSKDGILNLLQ